MGGCVVSLLERRNESQLIESEDVKAMKSYGPMSVPVALSETSCSSLIYRNGRYCSDEALEKYRNEFRTGPTQTQRFADVCARRKDEIAMCYRPIDKIVKEKRPMLNGQEKLLEITYFKERTNITFTELWSRVEAVSRGIASLGLPPRSIISIYEETRWEWLVTAYAIWMQDMIVSTVYANLGEDALAYALRETESKVIVCNGKSVPNLLRGIANHEIPECIIVYLDDLPVDMESISILEKASHSGIVESCDVGNVKTHVIDHTNTQTDCDSNSSANRKANTTELIPWNELLRRGRSHDGKTLPLQMPTDNTSDALIMYTSGTTGNPKGVIHTHGSITAGIIIMDYWLYSLLDPLPTDTYCAYLPLAHILEFGVVNIFLARGCLIGFGSPRTLTDITACPHGDLQEYKPAFIVGVPRIFDTLKKAVEAKLPPPGSLKRRVFNQAYASRLRALKEGKDTPYWNKKVFAQARQALGGRMRLALSGGGPLSASTHEFVNVVFGLIVIGWGLTETVCIGAIQRLGDIEPNCAGQVLVGEELKLCDTDVYQHTDKPEPRGEICLRGPFVFKGYYKQPELTREALDSEGWFHTGDVGSITEDGKIRIIGRIKALAKNALGEYIALEALESLYAGHNLVLNNCVCVIVNPYRHYIAGIVSTDKEKALTFAKEHNIDVPYPALLEHDAFKKAVVQSFTEMALKAKHKRFECISEVHLTDEEWTPYNGLLTAAMKLKRSAIQSRYNSVIDTLFEKE